MGLNYRRRSDSAWSGGGKESSSGRKLVGRVQVDPRDVTQAAKGSSVRAREQAKKAQVWDE